MDRMSATVGIDLGGTKVQAAVLDDEGKVIGQGRTKTPTKGGPSDVVDAIGAAVKDALKSAKADVGAVGIGTPGAVDPDTGHVTGAANLPGFGEPVPLRDLVRDALGASSVRIDNDVNVGTLAEHRLGAGQGLDDLLAVFAGSGVGGGVILDGRLRRGDHGSAGEIGHVVVRMGGDVCSCGRRGCMEAYAGRVAIERKARAAMAVGRPSLLLDIMNERGRARMTSGVLAAALDAGDDLTHELVDAAVAALGAGIASAVNVLDVQAVILGGGLGEKLGDPFTRRVEAAMRPSLFVQAVEVRSATLGDLGGAVGAALLAREAA
jgi:glucokinase